MQAVLDSRLTVTAIPSLGFREERPRSPEELRRNKIAVNVKSPVSLRTRDGLGTPTPSRGNKVTDSLGGIQDRAVCNARCC
jgi:hypothetical protein